MINSIYVRIGALLAILCSISACAVQRTIEDEGRTTAALESIHGVKFSQMSTKFRAVMHEYGGDFNIRFRAEVGSGNVDELMSLLGARGSEVKMRNVWTREPDAPDWWDGETYTESDVFIIPTLRREHQGEMIVTVSMRPDGVAVVHGKSAWTTD